MKRLTFIILFIGGNILFIFLQIHKNGKITEISYQNQSKQHEIDILKRQKATLTHQFQALKNSASVKDYATHELQMKNVSLQQVNIIPQNVGA